MAAHRTRKLKPRGLCSDSTQLAIVIFLIFFCGTALLQTALTAIAGELYPVPIIHQRHLEWSSYHKFERGNNISSASGRGGSRPDIEYSFPFCVAVLSAFPDKADAKHTRIVLRLIRQLLGPLGVHPRQLKVFCQGESCYERLVQRLGNDTAGALLAPGNFIEMNNTVNRTRYQGFIISENYRIMLEELFHRRDHEHCVIIEDDLALSPDALAVMAAGRRLMKADSTVFTVSLYNDNAYPWCASNPDFFRRTDQFSGLGFLVGRDVYRKLIRPKWDAKITWDALFQKLVRENRMVSVQPEMCRVMHSSNVITHAQGAPVVPNNKYEAQAVYTGSVLRNGYQQLLRVDEATYDTYIRDFVPSARVIRHLADAGFVARGVNLVLPETKNASIGATLVRAGLVGPGLGGVVRGAYKGSVFLRIKGNLVLLLSPSSPFYSPFLNSKLQELDLDGSISAAQAMMASGRPAVGRDLLGAFYDLKHNFEVIVANTTQSCHQACRSRNKACDLPAMWLLNKDCGVLQQVVAECASCSVQRQHPAVMRGSECQTAPPYWLSCIRVYTRLQQLCPCR